MRGLDRCASDGKTWSRLNCLETFLSLEYRENSKHSFTKVEERLVVSLHGPEAEEGNHLITSTLQDVLINEVRLKFEKCSVKIPGIFVKEVKQPFCSAILSANQEISVMAYDAGE